MKDLKEYANVTDAAKESGIGRSTLSEAVRRRDPSLELGELFGGRVVVTIESARRYAENPTKPGPKPAG